MAFATAHEWVLRLGEAKRASRLDDELERLGRIPLVICDEVGYIPFDPEAAALFFALVSSRYERSSLIVSSNKTFSAWTEIFGDAVAVAAMVDRLVHHAEVLVLKGDSYRLKGKGQGGDGNRHQAMISPVSGAPPFLFAALSRSQRPVFGGSSGNEAAQFSAGDSRAVFDRR